MDFYSDTLSDGTAITVDGLEGYVDGSSAMDYNFQELMDNYEDDDDLTILDNAVQYIINNHNQG
jgi:hypothetical protein